MAGLRSEWRQYELHAQQWYEQQCCTVITNKKQNIGKKMQNNILLDDFTQMFEITIRNGNFIWSHNHIHLLNDDYCVVPISMRCIYNLDMY